MTARARPTPGAYARAIERALARVRERPGLLSPRDWEIANDWHRRGVPLALVLEAIEGAAARRARTGTLPAGLRYVVPAVEEAWSVVQAGRRGPAGPVPLGAGEPDVRAQWAASQRSLPPPLARAVEDALAALAGGADPRQVDDGLDVAIAACAPADLRARVEWETERRMERYRARMPDASFRATVRRAVLDGLRARLVLPRSAR